MSDSNEFQKKVLQHVPSVSLGESTDPTNAAAHHERVRWVETTCETTPVCLQSHRLEPKVDVKWRLPVENSQVWGFLFR